MSENTFLEGIAKVARPVMVMWSAADPVRLSFSTNCFSIPTVTVAHILARLGGRWMILHPHRENDRCASVCVCV